MAAAIPAVVSPYAGRKLTLREQLSISAFWFATNFHWGALLVIMLPHQVAALAPAYRVPALSLLTGVAAIVALIVPLIVGALSDRCTSAWGRRRPFIAAGVGINVVGLALMAITFSTTGPIKSVPHGEPTFGETLSVLVQSPGFLLFLLSYMLVQFGNNVATASYSGVIPDLVPEDQRGAASGYMALMSQLGTLFGAVGCGALLSGQPELVKYIVVGIVLAAVSLGTLLGIREVPLPFKPAPIKWVTYAKSLWIDPRKYPDFAWVWITRALVMLGFYSVLPFINYYLMDVIGIAKPDGAAAALTGVLLIASSVSGVYGGYISDRIGRKRVVYVANVVIAVMAISFIFCHNMTQVMLAGVFFGLGFGAYTSVDWALGTDVLPSKKDAAKEMAVWHIAMTLPQSLAAPASGYLISRFGMTTVVVAGETIYHYNIGGYSAVFILCAVCFALGAYFLKNVKGVK